MSGPTNLKQRGNLFKVELQSATSPTVYNAFLDARSSDFTISQTTVDVTAIDSAGMKELLASAGVGDVAITLQGVFKDTVNAQQLAAAALAGTFLALKLLSGNGDTWAGSFIATSYKRAGTYNGEETYNVTFNSTGPITYTAHA